MNIEEVLRNSPIFAGLPPVEIQETAKIARERAYRAGEVLFREGEQAQALYVLVEGKISLEMHIPQLSAQVPARTATVRVLTPGESFGWSAVIEPHVYAFSGRCIEACRAVAIDGARLKALLESDPHMGYQVLKKLSGITSSRLRDTIKTLLSERGLAFL